MLLMQWFLPTYHFMRVIPSQYICKCPKKATTRNRRVPWLPVFPQGKYQSSCNGQVISRNTRWHDDMMMTAGLATCDDLTPFSLLFTSSSPPPLSPTPPCYDRHGRIPHWWSNLEILLEGKCYNSKPNTRVHMDVFYSDADKMQNHWITEYWRFFGLLFQFSKQVEDDPEGRKWI